MKSTKSMGISRRRFITLAGMTTAAGLAPARVLNGRNVDEAGVVAHPAPAVDGSDLPVNRIARVLETKMICFEPGKLLGEGTEYVLNTNGHWVTKKKVVEPNRYLGWPTVLKTRQGRLMVAFSGDRDAHVCPYGKTQMIISDDQGKTWSEPVTINNTPLDDRDAGLIQTPKQTFILSWFTSLAFERSSFQNSAADHRVVPPAYNKYFRIGEKISPETKKKWLGCWIRRSEDLGKTWGEPIKTTIKAPHGPRCLKNGQLLYIGKGIWDRQQAIVIERSVDDGKTWNLACKIPNGHFPVKYMEEPHLVELESGKIIAMIRNEPVDENQCFLLQSESTDGGTTWTEMRSTQIWGYPPHLLQLKNGWLVVSYGYRREPYGERACISKDEGRTWDIANEIILAGAPARDLGYPSSVQLDDGSVLTVYYQAPKLGEPACIYSTKWELI